MERPTAQLLPDGRRLHLHHGPIDLIVEAFGDGRSCAYERVIERFETVLDELAPQLTQLRQQVGETLSVGGSIAHRMLNATRAFAPRFITPMAAVAGSVADEMLDEITTAPGILKAYVNNGGDAAFYLTKGQSMTAALAGMPDGRISISARHPYRGIATSGWRGRSHSLGIADSVSVLAIDAATADAAATLIANTVDLLGHPAITREPARKLSPDSDLGERLVTTGVGSLSAEEKSDALDNGVCEAEAMLATGLIGGAALSLSGMHRFIGLDDNLIQMDERVLEYG